MLCFANINGYIYMNGLDYEMSKSMYQADLGKSDTQYDRIWIAYIFGLSLEVYPIFYSFLNCVDSRNLFYTGITVLSRINTDTDKKYPKSLDL